MQTLCQPWHPMWRGGSAPPFSSRRTEGKTLKRPRVGAWAGAEPAASGRLENGAQPALMGPQTGARWGRRPWLAPARSACRAGAGAGAGALGAFGAAPRNPGVRSVQHQHRQLAAGDDLLGVRAEDEFAQRATAVGDHDNHVAAGLFG